METQHLIIHYQHNYQIQSDYLYPNLLYKHHPAHSDENTEYIQAFGIAAGCVMIAVGVFLVTKA